MSMSKSLTSKEAVLECWTDFLGSLIDREETTLATHIILVSLKCNVFGWDPWSCHLTGLGLRERSEVVATYSPSSNWVWGCLQWSLYSSALSIDTGLHWLDWYSGRPVCHWSELHRHRWWLSLHHWIATFRHNWTEYGAKFTALEFKACLVSCPRTRTGQGFTHLRWITSVTSTWMSRIFWSVMQCR